MDKDDNFVAGWLGPLAGARQTVPRAELQAVLHAGREAAALRVRINLYTDHQNIVTRVEKGEGETAGAGGTCML